MKSTKMDNFKNYVISNKFQVYKANDAETDSGKKTYREMYMCKLAVLDDPHTFIMFRTIRHIEIWGSYSYFIKDDGSKDEAIALLFMTDWSDFENRTEQEAIDSHYFISNDNDFNINLIEKNFGYLCLKYKYPYNNFNVIKDDLEKTLKSI